MDRSTPLPDRVSLRRAAVGACLLWLAAVVVYASGRYGPFPTLEPARAGTVRGAGVFALVGTGKLLREGFARLTDVL